MSGTTHQSAASDAPGASAHAEGPFLQACRGEATEVTPVWFMRQAGRSLPEYREIRGSGTILRAIADPDLATEITLQPVRRYGVDAAILYSDIMTPVHAIGFGVDIEPGVGPVVERPFADRSDLQRLRHLDPEADTPYVLETVRNLVAELPVPLIAFAGAPFTVASYLIEGRPSRTYVRTKALMHTDEALWFDLMDTLADLAIDSLRSQVAAGASALQLFDSWAGALSPSDYERFVLPASTKVLSAFQGAGVPRIHFGVNTSELLGLIASAGAEVVGVDWRTPLDDARRRVPADVGLQGNLDPAIVAAGWAPTEAAALDVLRRGGGNPGGRGGHVFNLGHGVLPETDPAVLERVVELVHSHREGGAPT
jgi:uroporphyrinogen decarboxylase